MSNKQKLAEMVMQKMQEKKYKQERNRPHSQVLQLFVKFQIQDYDKLQQEITKLAQQIKTQQNILTKLQQYNQQFENSGKKQYPRIIVKPQFIASQHIQPHVKQFYRKSSNTYLRQDLLRKKHYQSNLSLVQKIKQTYSYLQQKQNNIKRQAQAQLKNFKEKRVRNLKQLLRLRSIKQEQQAIKRTIQLQKQKNKSLTDEFDLKKTNLSKRQNWADQLIKLIQSQKQLIQQTYNPVTYRNYLKKIFNIRAKNQAINKNLANANKVVQQIREKTEKKTIFLQKNDNLFVQGKSSDSPSKKKRYSLQNIQQKNKISPVKHSSLFFNLKKSIFYESSETPKTLKTQNSFYKTKSYSNSLGKTTASSMKNLLGNTDKKLMSSQSKNLKNAKNLSKLFA